MTLNSSLLKSTVVAALGGLLFGFDTAVISGTTRGLTEQYHLSPDSLGVTVAAALVGTLIGAALAAFPGDRYGRRDSLRVMAVLYFISALGCAFAWNWPSLVIFRFVGGLGIGGSSVLGPMYIAEISPAAWRGRLVGFFQFNFRSELAVARDFPLRRRTGNWRIIGPRADVHCGNLACRLARTSCRVLSIQYRSGNPSGLSLELSDRARDLWLNRVAMGAGRLCHSRIPLLRDAFQHSPQSTLAGGSWTRGGSQKRLANHRRRKLRATTA